MFGIELSRSEWAGLAGVAYLALRLLVAAARVLWWYATDSRRVVRPRPELALVTGVAVGALTVGMLGVATDWPVGGVRTAAYVVAAIGGFFLGLTLEFIIELRTWGVSTWLMAFRVPQYRERLLHGDEAVRLAAAQQLAALGLRARPAYPELLAVLRHDDSADVRAAAGQAVLFSTPDPAPEDDAGTPREARAALSDPDVRVRTLAAAVLEIYKVIPPAELLPVFCDGLKSEDETVRSVAATGLEKLGPAAEPAVPALKAAALDPERANPGAVVALGKVGPAAVPALVEILERAGDRWSRYFAAEALGEIGAPGLAALPALRAAAANPDTIVAEAARRAIRKLGGDIK
jgi:HEAT repeat protein